MKETYPISAAEGKGILHCYAVLRTGSAPCREVDDDFLERAGDSLNVSLLHDAGRVSKAIGYRGFLCVASAGAYQYHRVLWVDVQELVPLSDWQRRFPECGPARNPKSVFAHSDHRTGAVSTVGMIVAYRGAQFALGPKTCLLNGALIHQFGGDDEMSKKPAAESAKVGQAPPDGAAPETQYVDQRDMIISIDALREHPDNPRTTFNQDTLEELAASIRSKGLLQHILVRPFSCIETLKSGPADLYQIVAGARRFRACDMAGVKAIPCTVRELTDKDVAEIMLIENGQREDLTEIEEARGFKNWVDTYGLGPQAFAELARITGKSDTYVRRRVKVLELPKEILDMWGEGELIYGHLELLVRLNNPPEALSVIEELSHNWQKTVRYLRNLIESRSPALKHAKFPRQDCKACEKNTHGARALFGPAEDEAKEERCLDRSCFKHKQNDFLLANWSGTKLAKERGTNGFRFIDEVRGSNGFMSIYNAPKAACKECAEFVSTIDITCDSSGYPGIACAKPECGRATYKESAGRSAPKVDWPTVAFNFLKARLPDASADVALDDPRWLILAAIFITENYNIRTQFDKDVLGLTDDDHHSDEERWKILAALPPDQLKYAFAKALLARVGSINYYGSILRAFGAAVGVSLEDFTIDAKFLRRFDEAGIRALAKEFDLFGDEKVAAFVAAKKESGKWKSSDPKKMEKKQLVECFLNSGFDLKGKVPAKLLEL